MPFGAGNENPTDNDENKLLAEHFATNFNVHRSLLHLSGKLINKQINQ